MGNHSSGTPFCLGQIQSREDAPAFRFGDGAQILARISQQQDPRHALGILGGKVADDANDDVGFVLAIGTIDGNQTAFGVKIVLDKIAGGKFRPRVFRSGREHLDDFVRVDEPALAHADNFLVVFGQRFDGLQFVGGPEGNQHTAAARARDAHHHIAQFAGRRIGNAGAHHHLFQSQAFGRGRQFVHNIAQFIPA